MNAGLASRRMTVASTGLVAIIVMAALVGYGAEDPAAPSVKAAVRQAITDLRDAATYKTEWTAGRLSDTGRAETHQTLASRLSESMAGKALQRWKSVLDAAIDRDSDGEHVIVTAGGVDKIEYASVEVLGTTATATGRAYTWVTWIILQKEVAGPTSGRPAGWDLFEASLELIDGRWYVTDLAMEPELGG